MSTLLQRAVVGGAQEHVFAVGGQRRVLDQFAAAVDPHVVVGVSLVGLQQRELRVVAEIHSLVAKGPTQLEHPLDATDAQPLEVQLRGDAQIEVEVVGVDVGEERTCVGATVDLLQDRGLDLQKALADQCFANRMQDAAAGPDQVARLGVDGQVDIAGAHPRLLVGQPLPLVGQRAQALADQPPAAHDQRLGAQSALAHRAGHLDEVAEVDGTGEVCGATGVQLANCQAAVALHPTSHAAARTAHRRSRGSAARAPPLSRRRRRSASTASATVWLGGCPTG